MLVAGYIDVYVARGEYQIYAQAMEIYGKGAQLLELERIKAKLKSEGLFDESRKRKINIFPQTVAVISGENSAAMADIQTNLLRRFPVVNVLKIPAQVQGEGASKDLIRAFNEALSQNPTTIIIGRGGGSSEDLNAFNDEALARLVANSPVPVISAVGHEIDTTLVDYVSDKRASTPTGAAELATIDIRELFQTFMESEERMYNALTTRIVGLSNKLELLKNRAFFNNPSTIYADKIVELNNTKQRLELALNVQLERKNRQLETLKKQLQGINPTKVLERGFAVISDENGKIITSINSIKPNDTIKTRLSDGTIESKVTKKEKE